METRGRFLLALDHNAIVSHPSVLLCTDFGDMHCVFILYAYGFVRFKLLLNEGMLQKHADALFVVVVARGACQVSGP